MASDPDLVDLVAPLREDNVSGASELSRTAAEILKRGAVRAQAGSVDELRWGLGEVCQKILEAQPAMGPMLTLVRRVLDAVEGKESVEDGRLAAVNAADDFSSAFEARAEAVMRAAAGLLPAGGTVATISASGTVRRLLCSEAAPRGIRVVCFESRPLREGRSLARSLVEAGVESTYAVDAAIESIVPACDLVIFGTDAVGDEGVTNKIGSTVLARAARKAARPVYVLADETKLLPQGYPQIVGDDRPGAEVWDDAPEELTVWNRYFEVVPVELVTGIVVEEGLRSTEELDEVRARMKLPSGLGTWAAGRASR